MEKSPVVVSFAPTNTAKKASPKRKIEPQVIAKTVAPKKFSRFMDPHRKPLGYKPPKYWKITCGLDEFETIRRVEEKIKFLVSANAENADYQLPFRVTSLSSKVFKQFRQDGSSLALYESTLRVRCPEEYDISELTLLFEDCDLEEWHPGQGSE